MSTDSKPLTLLKAYRIAYNLDANKICVRAAISRPYLTRLEQGAVPTADVALRVVQALRDKECVRIAQPSAQPNTNKIEMLEHARRLIEIAQEKHTDFAEGIQEVHLLYPSRYQEGVIEHGHS